MNIKIAVSTVVLSATLSLAAYAGSNSKEMAIPSTPPSDAGFYVAAFGGANFAQDYGDKHGSVSASPIISNLPLNLGFNDSVGGVGGLKVGYKFDSIDLGSGFVVQPAAEFEAFYLGSSPKINYSGSTGIGGAPPTTLSTSGQLKGNMDSAAFFANGILRFKTGTIITPYIGVGVGGEYMSFSGISGNDTLTASNSRGSSTTTGSNDSIQSADDFVFATQGLAGFDIEITKNWDLFTEYKFVAAIDPSFDLGQVGTFAGSNITAKVDPSYIGQHLITAGIKYNF